VQTLFEWNSKSYAHRKIRSNAELSISCGVLVFQLSSTMMISIAQTQTVGIMRIFKERSSNGKEQEKRSDTA